MSSYFGKDKFYFNFKDNNVFFYDKYVNKKKIKSYFIKNGKADGYAFYYSELTGEINIILEYENGRIKDGIYNYYLDGQLNRKEEFKNGVLVKKHWNENFKFLDEIEEDLLRKLSHSPLSTIKE